MPPGPKRKRGDRTYSYDGNDGSQRPSPHRPGNLSLAQQHRHQNDGPGQSHYGQSHGIVSRGGGATGGAAGMNTRRVSRSGRGGSSGPNAGQTQHLANASVAGAVAAYSAAGANGGTVGNDGFDGVQSHAYAKQKGSTSGRGGRSVAAPTASSANTRKSSSISNIAPNHIATSVETHNSASPSSLTNVTKATPALPSHAPVHRSQHNQIAPPKSIPKPKPRAYAYEFLNDERAAAWTSTGKESFINAVMDAWASKDKNDGSNGDYSDSAVTVLSKTFQELTRAALDGRLSAIDAGSTIKDILDEVTASKERGKEKENGNSEGVSNADIVSVATISPLGPTSLFLDTISILTDADHSSPALKPFMLATGIPASRMREELETPILVTIGLLRDTFARMGIRKTTNILYRQSNYNLLREETEGYSKLITEYFTTSNSGPPTGELVTETFQRILALIGAFDLDVGRVLDVTLDVFANLLVKNYRFFIKLLRTSSWWPAKKAISKIYATTGLKTGDKAHAQSLDGFTLDPLPQWALPGAPGWQTTDEERDKLNELRDERDSLFWSRVREVGISTFFELGSAGSTLKANHQGQKSLVESPNSNRSANVNVIQDKDDRDWTQQTGTHPPIGNRTAAQLLGFKLRFYASAARSPQDTLPDNLIHLAALMIKTGFISLRDLYPHLYPSDEAMEGSIKDRLTKEKVERDRRNRPGAGSMNALMTAGALSDDTVPPSVSKLREIENNRTTAKATATAGGDTGGTRSETGDDTGTGEAALPEPADQKIHLLKSLLLIGALPEALFILGKFPWLMDLVPDLPDYLHRVLNYSLSKVYEPLRPLHDRDSIRTAKKLLADQSVASAKGDLRFTDPPPRKILRWANLDKNDSGDGIDYRFYWEDWADNIPMCQDVEDVFLLCSTLLNLSGVKIGRDPDLLMKLSRIGKYSLTADMSESNLARWVDLSKRLLVPALSLTRTNPGLVNEMYDLLKFYPIRSRFNIYAEWYTGQISRMSDIKAAFDIANAETKVILKRISKTNTKPMARALAKIAYASPGIVFEVTLNQIEAYENLIEVVVECARYFTYLGYDVLTWSLMNAMGGGGRAAVEKDGMMTKQWLKMLAIFAGRVFKRYSVMSPAPILQFVAHQLRSGNVTGLDVLEQMINFMAGIRPDVNFNEAQIQAMAGGELLQTQTLEQLYNQRTDTKMSSKRLLKALTDPSLAVYMLIAVAQVRQTAIFRKSEISAPPKVLGNSLDRIHRVFIQYLDMLRGNLTIKDFDESVPDVVSLIGDFKLDANAAFAISRPSISHALAEADAALKAERQERAARANAAAAFAARQEQKDKHTSPEVHARQYQDEQQQEQQQEQNEHEKTNEPLGSDRLADKSTNEINAEIANPQIKSEQVEDGSPVAVVSTDTEMKDTAPASPMQISSTTLNTVTAAPAHISWTMPLRSLIDRLRTALPENFEKSMSISFYATFWQLSLHDMLVPSSSYEDEIKRQRDKIAAVSADRADLSAFGMKRKEVRKKELNELQDRLRTELKSQIHKYSQVRTRLQKEKDCWFTDFARRSQADRDALHDALLQECFLPRSLFSSLDALYTFKMIFYLHASGAPGFSTVELLDRIFREKQLTALIFYCTLQESESLGRFLSELLKELRRWHADPSVYEKMAAGPKKDLPGFAEKLKEDGTPETFIGYEDFRRRLLRWHKNITGAFKTCLAEGEYMRIRNAINVLKPLPPHYPVVEWMGNNILELLKQYEKDPREDIKVSTMSLLGELQKRKKGWIIHAAFSTVDRDRTGGNVIGTENGAAATAATSSAAVSAINAPSAGIAGNKANASDNTEDGAPPTNIVRLGNVPNPINTSIKPMNVTAPEFQSQRKPSTSRSIKTPTTARSEFEDGEIDDIRSGEPRSASTIAGGTGNAMAMELNQKIDSGTVALQSTAAEKAADMKSSMPAPPPKVTPFTHEDTVPASGQAGQDQVQPIPTDAQQSTQKPARSGEPVRTQGGQSATGRTVHALPQRPEQPLRRHQFPDRPADRDSELISSNREGPSHNTQLGHIRNDKSSTDGRDATSELHIDPGAGDRTSQRIPDRNHGQGTERNRRDSSWQQLREPREQLNEGMKPPPRDLRSNVRNLPWPNNQSDGSPPQAIHPTTASSGRDRSRSAAYASDGPPPALGYGADRGPPANHERALYNSQQSAVERQQHSKQPMNSTSYSSDRIVSYPERFNDARDREGRRERVSRPQSPKIGAAQGNYASAGSLKDNDRREDRHTALDRHSQRSGQHDRYDHGDTKAPTGPRDEQRLDRANFVNGGGGRSTRGRELFNSPLPPRQQQDPNHGRLSQDPNYGRLVAESDIPQGPRGRVVGRGNRNFSASQSAQPSQRTSEPESQDGPSPVPRMRDRLVSIGNQNEQSQPQSSLPVASPASDTSDLTGIHPSRLGQFQEPRARDFGPSQTGTGAPLDVKPSFSPHASRQRPPFAREKSNSTEPSTPNFRVDSNAYPPSDRRSEDKRFAGLQNVLQQGTNRSPQHDQVDHGTSILGRASRQGSFQGSNPSLTHGHNRDDGQTNYYDRGPLPNATFWQGQQRQDKQGDRIDIRGDPNHKHGNERVTRLQNKIDRNGGAGGPDAGSDINNDGSVGGYRELRRMRSEVRDYEGSRERGSREHGEGTRTRGDNFHQRGSRHVHIGESDEGYRRGGPRNEQSQLSTNSSPHPRHYQQQQQNNANWPNNRDSSNYNNPVGGINANGNTNANANARNPRYTRDLRSRQSMNFPEKRGERGEPPPLPPLHPLSSGRSNNLGPDTGPQGHSGGGGRDRRDRDSREGWDTRDGRKRLRDGGGNVGGVGGDAHPGGGVENKRARRSN